MTFTEEFEQQWKGISNYLESEMIKQTEHGSVDITEIQRLFNNEKKRWTLPGQYQCAWLQKLRSENVQIADEFETALSDITLAQEQSVPIKSGAALTVSSAAGGALIGFMSTKLLHAALYFSIFGTIGLGLVGGMAGKAFADNKRAELTAAERDVYMKQIQNAGKTLIEIVQNAD